MNWALLPPAAGLVHPEAIGEMKHHLIITMIKWIWTSSLPIKKFLSILRVNVVKRPPEAGTVHPESVGEVGASGRSAASCR